MASSFMFFVSILIYLTSFIGMIGNLIVLFAFLTHAVRRKALQPLDRIIVNMGLVNFFLCCYKAIPGMLVFSSTRVFGEEGCRVLLYTYHTLRLVSIWSVENLSIVHLIKIRRPSCRWAMLIHRHQSRYVNGTLVGCWVASVLLQIPYLQYEKTGGQRNKTIAFLATSTCLKSTESFAMKFSTYASIGLDMVLILLVVVLNGFIVDLLWKHHRKVKASSSAAAGSRWNKHTAQATKILLSLLSIYVVCWIANDMVWLTIVLGYNRNSTESSFLNGVYGVLSSIYYSASSYVMVFGYKKVREYLAETCWCLRCRRTAVAQAVSLADALPR
ncbi:PREDICTED: vomeronasal type-1 receptor 1-like [Thamnophis sirtalis]|uniref:Vomeronasal type-1 receptor n=1 Tax=Thamnophis sirtalis TaxID=35019 RepID=A0A6I9XWM3_9SAUR|nr:PREDICTED: vomeronasal type-1 receptor 1-like [Thamnophis sirtalis]